MSNTPKVYISAALTIPPSIIDTYAEMLEDSGFEVTTYRPAYTYLDAADALLVVLPKNAFNTSENDLTEVVAHELARAYAQGKPIFLGYKPSGYAYSIYNTETNGKFIRGIAGTANDIFISMDKKNENFWDGQPNTYGYLNHCETVSSFDENITVKIKVSKCPAKPKESENDPRLLLMLG